MWAAMNDRIEMVEIVKLLINKGAEVNVQDNRGVTPLMHALDLSNLEVIKYLITAGADTNIQDNEGYTIVDYALWRGDPARIKLAFALDNINNPPRVFITSINTLNNQYLEIQFITSKTNLTAIEIEYMNDLAEVQTKYVIAGASRNFLIQGLTPNKVYIFRIRVKNINGWGSYHEVVYRVPGK